MSENGALRWWAAATVAVAAIVLMLWRHSFGSPIGENDVISFGLVALVVLAAFAWLPLRDRVDRGVLLITGAAGLMTLVICCFSQELRMAYLGELLVLAAGVVIVWRSVAKERASESEHQDGSPQRNLPARMRVVGVIVIITIGSFLYRWLVWHRLEQTSALFIGIPALLAILVTLLPRPKSATGMICMVTVIALLVSGIFLGEGFICILMASPLFLLIAVIIGAITDWATKRGNGSRTTMSCLLILAFVPMSFEGTRPALSFSREEVVRREVVVRAAPMEIATRIAAQSHFDGELPAYLRLGFPRPVATAGSGVQVGDRRRIHFAGGEGTPGDLVMEVAASSASAVEFREISDSSHLAHWLKWETAKFAWTALPEGQTRVTCTVRYRRLLDPAWYFKPWERYGVGLATDYLLRSMTED